MGQLNNNWILASSLCLIDYFQINEGISNTSNTSDKDLVGDLNLHYTTTYLAKSTGYAQSLSSAHCYPNGEITFSNPLKN